MDQKIQAVKDELSAAVTKAIEDVTSITGLPVSWLNIDFVRCATVDGQERIVVSDVRFDLRV